jgi:ferric iron reductase protein FhuF
MTGELPSAKATLPGSLLADQAWLADRVDQLGWQSGCFERRTNATLWWYSASAVLLGPAVRALALSGAGVDVSPGSVRFTLRSSGYLEQVIPGPALNHHPGAAVSDACASGRGESDGGEAGGGEAGGGATSVLGVHLDAAFGQVIEPLARTGRATERSLWAIAADSLATVVLSAAPVLAWSVTGGDPDALPELASSIARAGTRLRPLPRYVEIGVPDSAGSSRRYVKRGSCCLLIRVPDGKCLTCPNQTPADRLARLTRHAQSQP